MDFWGLLGNIGGKCEEHLGRWNLLDSFQGPLAEAGRFDVWRVVGIFPKVTFGLLETLGQPDES